MRTLYSISWSHELCDANERIRVKDGLANTDILQKNITNNAAIYGCVRLETCNRVELFLDANIEDVSLLVNQLVNNLSLSGNKGMSWPKIYSGVEQVTRHVLALAAGTKSQVLGDDQILHQVKCAFQKARSNNNLSTLLERLFQSIMRCNKQIINNTEYKVGSTSLAYQTLKLLRADYGKETLARKKLVIIGAGKMANEIVKYLPKFNFERIYISNRTSAKAKEIAKYNSLTSLDMSGVNAIEEKIVINCASIKVLESFSLGKYDKLVDLSDYSHLYTDKEGILTLEYVQQLISSTTTQRLNTIIKVKEMMRKEVNSITKWYTSWVLRRKQNTAKTETRLIQVPC